MSIETTASADRWISTREARERLGLPQFAVAKLVREGAFVVRRLPSMRPQILLSSLERIERESVRPSSVAV